MPHDLRHGLRQLADSPSFKCIAILAIAQKFGAKTFGAKTAIFSVVTQKRKGQACAAKGERNTAALVAGGRHRERLARGLAKS